MIDPERLKIQVQLSVRAMVVHGEGGRACVRDVAHFTHKDCGARGVGRY